MKKETQQLVLMLMIGTAVGAIGANLWGGSDKSATTLVDTELTEQNGSTTTDVLADNASQAVSPSTTGKKAPDLPGGNDVIPNERLGLGVRDQKAGETVIVQGLTFTAPQWVVVYDERAGKPSWILGAKRFLAGDIGGEVPLLRETVSGEKYYVVIHNDDGDLFFDKSKDTAPEYAKATIVSFMAQ